MVEEFSERRGSAGAAGLFAIEVVEEGVELQGEEGVEINPRRRCCIKVACEQRDENIT